MTATATMRPLSLPTSTGRWIRDEPLFSGAALVIAFTMLPTLLAMLIDTRLVHGENPWVKPLKFQVSLSLYLATLVFYARWLPSGMTQRRGYRIFAIAVVAAIAAESLWINGAAAFATTSHFNVSTPLMEALYAVMGPLAVLLTSASTVYGVAIWRNRDAGLSSTLRSGLGLGLVLTLPLTFVVAGYLAQNGGRFVGTPVLGEALPLLGWSTEVGDLRVSHFLATHALHVIPLGVLLFARSQRGAWLIASAYTLAVAATFVQALQGKPLIAL